MRITAQFIFCLLLSPLFGRAQSTFQPYRSPGNNLIHVTAADMYGSGFKKNVIGMTVDGRVIAFPQISAGTDVNNVGGLWTNDLGQFGFMLGAADINTGGDEILVPCADGHLRILDKDGVSTDWAVSSGALYCVGVGVNSNGFKRIVTGGVDGKVYIYSNTGILKGTKTMSGGGVVRRVVVGNFDGAGGDEIAVFYKTHGFAGTTSDGSYLDVIGLTDTNSLDRPSYWKPNSQILDDVASTLNWWTDKQLPSAYDMTGDGIPEVVAHWGLMNPTNSAPTTTSLSELLRSGEGLKKDVWNGYNQFTDTGNQYIMQKSVPGNFRDGTGFAGKELFTLLGDDLYLWGYNSATTSFPTSSRVYGYSHSLYHFTDGARLEGTNGLDKIVLCGPNNGDDRFYVVDLSSSQWTNDAKQIHTAGALLEIDAHLEELTADIDGFSGVAAGGYPVRFIDIATGAPGWWVMTDTNIVAHADQFFSAQTNFYWMVNGDSTKKTSNVVYYAQCIANMGTEAATHTNVTVVGLTKWCAALAERGVHFAMLIGHGGNLYFDQTSDVADWFQASVTNGECHMMLRVSELQTPSQIGSYQPLMDALNTRAASLGVAPPKLLLDGKGAYFTTLTTNSATAYFKSGSAYGTNIILGAESSNSRLPEWSMAERVGLWMFGCVSGWGGEEIGDALAANRVAEWSDMRNGHLVLRRLLSQYVLGAKVFRVDGSISKTNPMYPDYDSSLLSNPWRQGMVSFLRIVEKRIYPAAPAPGRLKGISPVVVAVPAPSSRFNDQSVFHNWDQYAPQPTNYAMNNLECWNAYTKIPDHDATAFLYGTTRRWDNIFPTSASGFVTVVPFATASNLQSKTWWRHAYETDVNSWSGFGNLAGARDSISAELIAQKTNLLFYVDNKCFWQVTQQKNNSSTYFAFMMDPDALTPVDHSVKLHRGSAPGVWEVFDQFGSQTTPLGVLTDGVDEIPIDIPAGSVRILVLKRVVFGSLAAIGWDGGTSPALLWSGISGQIVTNAQGIQGAASSSDGFFGPDSEFAGASTVTNGAYGVLGAEHNSAKSKIDFSITNNTGGTISLDSVRFDYSRWYTNSPSTVRLIYLSGNLDVSNNTELATFSGAPVLGWYNNYSDFSVSLTNLEAYLGNGQSASFRLQASDALGASTAGGFDNIAITFSGQPGQAYDVWLNQYGLSGANGWNSADIEQDGMNNLIEYALGGDPDLYDRAEILPMIGNPSGTGTNGLAYTYHRRRDYAARRLTYRVEVNTNLISGVWSTNGVLDVGTAPLDSSFESVTNRISVDDAQSKYIRLRVEAR